MGNTDSSVSTSYDSPIDSKHRADGGKKRTSSHAHDHRSHSQSTQSHNNSTSPVTSTNATTTAPSSTSNTNNNNVATTTTTAGNEPHEEHHPANHSKNRHQRQRRRSASMLVHNPTATATLHAQRQHQRHAGVVADAHTPTTNTNITNNTTTTTNNNNNNGGQPRVRRSSSSLTTRTEYSLQQQRQQQPLVETIEEGVPNIHWELWHSDHPTATAAGAAPALADNPAAPADLRAAQPHDAGDGRAPLEPPPTLEGYAIENRVRPRQHPRHGTTRLEPAPHTVLTIHWDRLDPAQLPEAAPPPPSPREAARLAAAAARISSPDFYGRADYKDAQSSAPATPAYINMNASLRGSPFGSVTSGGKWNSHANLSFAQYNAARAPSSVASYSVGSRSPTRKRAQSQPQSAQPQPPAPPPRRRVQPRTVAHSGHVEGEGEAEKWLHYDDEVEEGEDGEVNFDDDDVNEEEENEEWGRPGSPSGWGSRQHTPAESEEGEGEEAYNHNGKNEEERERRRRRHLEDLKERKKKKHSRKGNVKDQDALSSTSDDFEDD